MKLKSFIPTIKSHESNNYQYRFTVFVPAYNSEKTIVRTLNSISIQSFKDFEIIIINDGSSDKTAEIIKGFINLNPQIEINFINNRINKHKMGIIYEAIQISKGEFFLIHDADDTCLPNALEIFNDEYLNIPEKLKSKISGVTTCCIDEKGEFFGDKFPVEEFYSDSFNLKHYHKITGEKWGFVKTDVLKSIQVNPEIFSKGLIPESFLWFTIAKNGYLTKFVNKITRIYYQDNENNLSSLRYEDKSFGMMIFSILFLNFFYKNHLLKKPLAFIKRFISLLLASTHLKYSLRDYLYALDSFGIKVVFSLCWPFRFFIKKVLSKKLQI